VRNKLNTVNKQVELNHNLLFVILKFTPNNVSKYKRGERKMRGNRKGRLPYLKNKTQAGPLSYNNNK
jgi:hypothetical protein